MIHQLQSGILKSSPCAIVLRNYDAACLALKAAAAVDEVKDILDKATAVRVYARQTQNIDLQNLASKIRIRAQLRLGQLLKESLLNDGNNGNNRANPGMARLPPLEKMGISQMLSSKCQRLAGVSKAEESVEKAMACMADKNQEITTAAVLRAVLPKATKKRVCSITSKNIADTRCLSMAKERLLFCQEKIKLLYSLRGGDCGPQVCKTLIVYRAALQEFSSLIEEMMDTIIGALDTNRTNLLS